MLKMTRLLRAAALAVVLVAAGQPTALSRMAGNYSETFDNGNVHGEEYRSTDRVAIYPLHAGRAKILLDLNFFNGHTCHVYGDATLIGEKLIFRDRDILPIAPPCRLAIWREGRSLRWEDNGTCQFHCGSRGGLSGGRIPIASRRAIRNAPIPSSP